MCFLKSRGHSDKISIINTIPQTDVHYFYQFDQKHIGDQGDSNLLGVGGFSQVVQATHKTTHEKYAIKIINKKDVQKEISMIQKQTQILAEMNHSHIVKFYQRFETNDKIYIVLEYCAGGELMTRLQEIGRFNEQEARYIFRQLASAISHIHEKNYIHRDLKLNNILFMNSENNSPVKLIDFGFATKIQPGQILKVRIGTPYYIAPEVIKGNYDQSCDIWSLGVILYVMILGYPPFYGQSQQQIFKMIANCQYKYQIDEQQQLSEEVQDLLKKCLAEPKKRISAQEILDHPWLLSNNAD